MTFQSVNENVVNAKNGVDSHFVCAESRHKRCQAFGMIQSVNENVVNAKNGVDSHFVCAKGVHNLPSLRHDIKCAGFFFGSADEKSGV